MAERDLKKLVGMMTLEEKAGMCSGKDTWFLKSVERLGIPGVMVADGPHGLRKVERVDGMGQHGKEAVCFPAACATAASFDRELLHTLGEALAQECIAEEISVILGPAVNIKRSPLCGRNFEYFSEDPFLAGELSASYINGVQKHGIGTSIKHFAANNQEHKRFTCSSDIDEQTLREIYLTGFEIAVKKSQPWTVMCSYNLINDVQSSQNPRLLTDILREEWGFEGYVMSDWCAIDDRVAGLRAGLELEMPGGNYSTDETIVRAVNSGDLPLEVLDRAVERILRIVFKYADSRTESAGKIDFERDHKLSAEIERECAVLLKNDGNVLPLKKDAKIAFIGEYAEKPRFQGGGSSNVNTSKTTGALEAVKALGIHPTYAKGFFADRDETSDEYREEALKAAKAADVAVIFAGLPDSFESEGSDRKHMRLPQCQNDLISEICAVQKNVVVVLHNGSPVEMPWIGDVSGVLEMYLGGQAVGEPCADLLFGRANPCGKLAESFPLRLEDNPSYLTFPGESRALYGERIFVGYRYYDKKKMPVLFPFGHGLSYTTFEYSGLELDKTTMTASLTVKNTGAVFGKEIVQLYVADCTNTTLRPEKELKGFDKISLHPGEEKRVEFKLDDRAFQWYNAEIGAWYAESGIYRLMAGASSRDIRLTLETEMTFPQPELTRVTTNTYFRELFASEKLRSPALALFREIHSETGREPLTEEEAVNRLSWAPIRLMRQDHAISDDNLYRFIGEMDKLLGESH